MIARSVNEHLDSAVCPRSLPLTIANPISSCLVAEGACYTAKGEVDTLRIGFGERHHRLFAVCLLFTRIAGPDRLAESPRPVLPWPTAPCIS